MEILQGFVDAVVGIFEDSGLLTLNWQNYVMIGISIVLLYLAIKKQYEPLLLLPIAFGMLLVNLYPSIMAPPTTQLLTEAQCTAQNVAVSGHAKTVIDGVTLRIRHTADFFITSIRVLSSAFIRLLSSSASVA